MRALFAIIGSLGAFLSGAASGLLATIGTGMLLCKAVGFGIPAAHSWAYSLAPYLWSLLAIVVCLVCMVIAAMATDL